MTSKEKIIFYTSVTMLLAGAGMFYLKKDAGHTQRNISLSAVKQADGWGYCINAGKNYVIEQNHIPGIAGYKTFISKEEALMAGTKVVEKLQHGQLPALTIAELENMHIHF